MRRFGYMAVIFGASICFLALAACSGSPEKGYLGDWERMEESEFGPDEDWATISQEGDQLYWEDCNGKFPATLADGELAIDVDGFPAAASLDKDSGILTYSVHGITIQYKRKE